MEPNPLVLGSNVRKRLKKHPEFVYRIKYTSSAAITNAVMATMFEIDNLRVARAMYNTANEKAPSVADTGGENLTYIADANAAWLGDIDPNPTPDSPTAIAPFAGYKSEKRRVGKEWVRSC